MKSSYANLMGRDGIVASVSFDQSLRGARFQFERAYFQYHLGRRAGRCARLRASVGVHLSHFYSRCRQLGVPVRDEQYESRGKTITPT